MLADFLFIYTLAMFKIGELLPIIKTNKWFMVFSIIAILFSCTKKNHDKGQLFTLLTPKETGVYFNNSISTNDSINLMNYEYLYNGGGVGIGNFNNDSLPDIIFTGNLKQSAIYVNKGSLQFKDITATSGINTKGKWCTGVSVIDINFDGLDDIYICVGGMGNKSTFPNLLYINQGDSTFTEEAASYGLADSGESIQSVFFDYDLDGDLDMYLLTGGGFENSAISARPILTNGRGRNTDRLYRNDFNDALGHSFFTNVSQEAGISIEGFGLGISVFDANNDKWPDVYVSNDYLSHDLLYVNNQDGTFTEKAAEYFGHTSHFSMGNDIADIDNDGLLDLITMDMLPENHSRRKLMSGASSYDFFQMALNYGYGHQHMRNMLQHNKGNGHFSEIGQLAGIDRTDWSWAPLMADFDHDGYNDIYITNGFGKDVTDMDFVKYREKKISAFSNTEHLTKKVLDCLAQRPAIILSNYIYKNEGDLTFLNKTSSWGLEHASISNGAAYADLDVDGDLDLIVSNIDQPAFIYKNNIIQQKKESANYIQIKLTGTNLNPNSIGTTVTLYTGDNLQTKYNQPVRGFQSTINTKLHFGLKNIKNIDSLKVVWPDDKTIVKTNIKANQLLELNYKDAVFEKDNSTDKVAFVFNKDSISDYIHEDKAHNDYRIQPLLTHGFSNQGPGMAVGDVNSDGLEDLFIGGSYGNNSTLLVQDKKGAFNKIEIADSELYEDLGALFFDANGDGLQDLYVVSGGSERYKGHKAYEDRLYLNDPMQVGAYTRAVLPEMLTSTATVVGGDYDNDGDIDLFIGGRVIPSEYPLAPRSYILQNNSGVFTDVTDSVCPELKNIGMVTAAVWTDFDNDFKLDLVVVGEYMPITTFKGNGKKLIKSTHKNGLTKSHGLWNSIIADDFDNDGDIDFIAGNLGLNSSFKATKENPLELHYADFDNNGSIDPILSLYEEGEYYPTASLDQLTKQLSILKKQILYYNTFSKSSTADILDLLGNKKYATLQSEELKSSYIENLGNNNFSISPLPVEAQIAPVNGILSEDINLDGLLDVLLVGNNYNTEVTFGRYDASIGTVLINQGNGDFSTLKSKDSNFEVIGAAKSIVRLDINDKESLVIIGRNNRALATFVFKRNGCKNIKPLAGESSALLSFVNGKQRKVEFSFGQGYLSQSSQNIIATSEVNEVTFYNASGEITRSILLNEKRKNLNSK